ncbi:MAG: hypothetical protein HQL27_09155, partial [Candidatus Omnitrophica bacterium]|nr:hypothetical protein [Candidatus Omnitrophota bacterium]
MPYINLREKFFVIVFSLAILTFTFGERLGASFGILGDENIYYLISLDLERILFSFGLDRYYVQRILPPFLVHLFAKITSTSLTVDNTVNIFCIFNVVLQVLTAHFWLLICKNLRIGINGVWVGFITLYVNYAILKYLPFTQVTTDMFAYFLGVLIVYLYLESKTFPLFLVSFIGSFAWPTVYWIGFIFLLFPRSEKVFRPEQGAKHNCGYILFPALFAFSLGIIYMKVLKPLYSSEAFSRGMFQFGAVKPLSGFLFLSVMAAVGYIFLSLRTLFRNGFALLSGDAGRKEILKQIFLAAMLIFTVKTTINYFSAISQHFNWNTFFENRLIFSISAPFFFLIAHVTYFGPIIILMMFSFRKVCDEIIKCGTGMILVAAFILVASLDSESRHLIFFFPILVPFAIKAVEGVFVSLKKMIFFCVLSLIFSKIWLTIGIHEFKGDV